MVSMESVFLVISALSTVLPLVLLRTALRNRDKPGATGLLILIVTISGWSLSVGALVLVTSTAQWRVSWGLTLLCASVASVGLFLLVWEYSRGALPTRPALVAIVSYPVLNQVAYWTNGIHSAYYDLQGTVPAGDLPPSLGIFFWMHVTAAYTLIFVGIAIMFGEVLNRQTIRRKQSLALLGSFVPTVAVNSTVIVGNTSFEWTPVGFVLSIFITAWVLFRGSFLDVVPIGRSSAVDQMADPMVTIDNNDRVVDCNPAARELVAANPDWEGMRVSEFFAPFADQYERFSEHETVETEITISNDGEQRHFDLSISPIRGPQNEQQGTLVVLRDITALRERERELRAREQDLDLLRQVQSRVLRHNIRNDLGVVKGYAEVLSRRVDDEHSEMVGTLIEKADDLVAISNKAQTIETLVEQDQEPTTTDIGRFLHRSVQTCRKQYPGVRFSIDVPETYSVRTIPAIEFAIENLLANAAEHNDSGDPTVEVRLEHSESETAVVVADNGSGIPSHELTVLEKGEETPLQHGSGIGLWLVDWVVRNSDTSVTFDTAHDGTTATLHIPAE